MAPNRTAALVVVCLLALAEVQRVEARKRKQPSGRGRGEQELDEFSGDSYAEFVDKYYKSSSSEPGQRLSGAGVGAGGRYDIHIIRL